MQTVNIKNKAVVKYNLYILFIKVLLILVMNCHSGESEATDRIPCLVS